MQAHWPLVIILPFGPAHTGRVAVHFPLFAQCCTEMLEMLLQPAVWTPSLATAVFIICTASCRCYIELTLCVDGALSLFSQTGPHPTPNPHVSHFSVVICVVHTYLWVGSYVLAGQDQEGGVAPRPQSA